MLTPLWEFEYFPRSQKIPRSDLCRNPVEFDQKYNTDVNIGDTFLYKVDGDENQYEGEIYRIYPEANSNNRKIALQVIAKDLKVGLFGEGKIITSDKEDNSVQESQE